jgi:hypothetical protein
MGIFLYLPEIKQVKRPMVRPITDPEYSRELRLADIKTFGSRKW